MPRAGSKERRIAVLLHEAPTRPDAAAGLLALAAHYLHEGQPMPQALAEYLANALEKAAHAEGADKADILACELMIKQSANAPIKGRKFDVAVLVAKHDARAQTKTNAPMKKELVSEVMDALGVSERTARDRINETRAGMKEFERLSRK